MKSHLCALFLALQLGAAVGQPIEYGISFPNAVHHEAEISVIFDGVEHPSLEVHMSRTSPGRYALHEFAKNVYRMEAYDREGARLPVERVSPHQWNVTEHKGWVRLSYTVFGDRVDGTYSAIDQSHAHLNIPATFAWARGFEQRPVVLRVTLPEESDWRVATQLRQEGDLTYSAPNMERFFDSPIEISKFVLREWEAAGQSFRLALHHEGSDDEADAYARMAEAIVLEAAGVFGELPTFDTGRYTFLADYLPYADGDGMEHRNSTVLSSSRTLEESAVRLAGTVAHEFFHAWNVERIRPRSLEPFRFDRENPSKELWFAEGFTTYYTPIIMHRAGLVSLDRFAEGLERPLNAALATNGRLFHSPVEMSLQAQLVDGERAVDPSNMENTFISYYSYGAAVGLSLDLLLRTRFQDVTLDDVMREMWVTFGRSEKPYQLEDIEAAVARVTGDAEFAASFFRDSVTGTQLPGLQALLERAGFVVELEDPERGSLAEVEVVEDEGGIVIDSAVLLGSPLYEAGLDRGARIRTLNGEETPSLESWEQLIEGVKPGDKVAIEFEQRGVEGKVEIVEKQVRQVKAVPFEHLGRKVGPDVLAFRNAWFGSKAIATLPELHKFCGTCSRSFAFELDFCPYDGSALKITHGGAAQ